MPVTEEDVKLDILEGTADTHSNDLLQFNRAVRQCRVRNLTFEGTESVQVRINEAIEAILELFPTETLIHPTIPIPGSPGNVPLSRARGRLIGPTIAIVELIYQYVITGGGFDPPTEQFPIVAFRSAFEHEEIFLNGENEMNDPVFHPSGLPAGTRFYQETEKKLFDEAHTWDHWMWPRPVLRLSVRARIPHNPAFTVLNLISTVNANAVNLLVGGPVSTFPPRSVRFDGLEVDFVSFSDGSFFYEVDYLFTIVNGAFLRQDPQFIELSPKGPLNFQWQVFFVPKYEENEWGINTFPV